MKKSEKQAILTRFFNPLFHWQHGTNVKKPKPMSGYDCTKSKIRLYQHAKTQEYRRTK